MKAFWVTQQEEDTFEVLQKEMRGMGKWQKQTKQSRVHNYAETEEYMGGVDGWSETREESHDTSRHNAIEKENTPGWELKIKPLKLFKYIKKGVELQAHKWVNLTQPRPVNAHGHVINL